MSVSEALTRRRFLGNAALVAATSGTALALPSTAEADLPISWGILNAYAEWLHLERRTLAMQMYPGLPEMQDMVPCGSGVCSMYSPLWSRLNAGDNSLLWGTPLARAPLILSTAGVNLDDVREVQA
ncbi:twin-arginine translocation signal domain-containing protein [Aurantimonas sp. A2-1-M11]|uniref:twin-arginine translocation signal domain-containing protein n=1 Tax=Aurantimonas sp. A2-1-M11 TaxID=3113712 RepID=UPI002F94C6FF